MIENMEAYEENFKECISEVNKTIEGIGTANRVFSFFRIS